MRKIYLHMLILLAGISSRCSNPQEEIRNRIQFKDSVRIVELDISIMNKLMNKLLTKEGEMRNYFFDIENDFYVNSQILGKIDDEQIRSNKVFLGLNFKEREEFLRIVNFLKDNFISSTYLDRTCECYVYGYRELDDSSFKTNRLIYLNENNKEYSTVSVEREILDKKCNLVLIGYNSPKNE